MYAGCLLLEWDRARIKPQPPIEEALLGIAKTFLARDKYSGRSWERCRLGGCPMGNERASVQTLSEWLEVSRSIEIALEGLTEDDLNFRGGSNGWSIRENVHHVVESNLVACTIVFAVVGKSGFTYDCSW